jgi:phosphoribosylaminoimidazole-succinocarboxamide synthase
MNKELLHKGSVKDIYIAGERELSFHYSDRFSVFDWGELPDQLQSKGESLANMAFMFFDIMADCAGWEIWKNEQGIESSATLEYLCQHGLSHHNIGLENTDGAVVTKPTRTNQLRVHEVDIHKPSYSKDQGWDYSAYENAPTNCLIPLEVVFRFGLPAGSSLFKRLKDENYARELGIDGDIKEGTMLDTPIVEFSSKLENVDRYMSVTEAKRIAGLTEHEFSRLKETTLLVARRLKTIFEEMNIILWDGKFELAFGASGEGGRELMMVDSIGPDELRLTSDGVQMSKENLRRHLRTTTWYEQVEQAKVDAESRGEVEWKPLVKESAPHLSSEVLKANTDMYQAITNELSRGYYDFTVFEQCPELSDVVASLKEIEVKEGSK